MIGFSFASTTFFEVETVSSLAALSEIRGGPEVCDDGRNKYTTVESMAHNVCDNISEAKIISGACPYTERLGDSHSFSSAFEPAVNETKRY